MCCAVGHPPLVASCSFAPPCSGCCHHQRLHPALHCCQQRAGRLGGSAAGAGGQSGCRDHLGLHAAARRWVRYLILRLVWLSLVRNEAAQECAFPRRGGAAGVECRCPGPVKNGSLCSCGCLPACMHAHFSFVLAGRCICLDTRTQPHACLPHSPPLQPRSTATPLWWRSWWPPAATSTCRARMGRRRCTTPPRVGAGWGRGRVEFGHRRPWPGQRCNAETMLVQHESIVGPAQGCLAPI